MSVNSSILLFTDWYEPGYKAGGPIQSCKNIVITLRGEADFYIVTSDRDLGDNKPYEGIEKDKWIDLAPQVKICYCSPGWLTSGILKTMIHEIGPTAVYLNSMYSYRFTLLPLWNLQKMKYKGKIVLAPRGMLRASALAVKKTKKTLFLSLMSRISVSRKIIFHATDEQEKADVRKHFGTHANVFMAENILVINKSIQKKIKEEGQLKCVYLSRVHPIKNLLFGLNVLGLFKPGADIQFDIYGPTDDPEYYLKCFEAARKLEGRVTVNFMGPLDHGQVFNVLQQYHLFFLPTQGENFGHAIVESLSAGCPVLISDRTPWKDLSLHNAGWALPLNDPHIFKDKIEEVLQMNETEMNHKSQAAFNYCQSFISAADFKNKYLELFGITKFQIQ